MYCDQSQIYPIAWQCLDAPEFCEYYIHELHGVCSSVFSPHSIEHSNHEACTPHICTPPNQKPAQKNLFHVIVGTFNSKIYEADSHAIPLHIGVTSWGRR